MCTPLIHKLYDNVVMCGGVPGCVGTKKTGPYLIGHRVGTGLDF